MHWDYSSMLKYPPLELKDNIQNFVEIIKIGIHPIKVNPFFLFPIIIKNNSKQVLALIHKSILPLIRTEGMIKHPNIIPKMNSPTISNLPSNPFIYNLLIFLNKFPDYITPLGSLITKEEVKPLILPITFIISNVSPFSLLLMPSPNKLGK